MDSRVFFVLLETFSSISALISSSDLLQIGSWTSLPNTTRSPNYVDYFSNWFHHALQVIPKQCGLQRG
jgi:hypothetical protein